MLAYWPHPYSFFMLITFIYKFSISSNFNQLYHIIKLVLFGANTGYEAIATCILAQSAYLLLQSYRMIPVNPREKKMVWRRYVPLLHYWYNCHSNAYDIDL